MFIISDNGRAGWSWGSALHGLPVFVFLHSQLLDLLHQLWPASPTEAGRPDVRLDDVTGEEAAQGLLLHLQQLQQELVHLPGKTVRSGLDMVWDLLR